MKIKVKTQSEKFWEEHDYRSILIIEVNGETEAYFLEGEPEDAKLGRDYNDCYKIPELMKLAYEAGKNNESFEIEKIKVDDFG